MPERKRGFQNKLWQDYARVCSFLPQDVGNTELKLKHIMHEENMLTKCTLIYSLVALLYEQKHTILNVPIGSIKTIQNIIYYFSLLKHQQKDTISVIIYVA